MARAKKPRASEKEREPEPEPDEEDEDDAGRDYVIARIAIARNALQAGIDSLDECTAAFANPEDDADGKERVELLDSAIESVGFASRALEDAEGVIEEVNFELGEPWDEGDDGK